MIQGFLVELQSAGWWILGWLFDSDAA